MMLRTSGRSTNNWTADGLGRARNEQDASRNALFTCWARQIIANDVEQSSPEKV